MDVMQEHANPTHDIKRTGDALIMPVDAEHTGIRLAGCGSLIGFTILAAILLGTFTPIGGVFAGLVGLIIGAVAANLLERYLKTTWHSGRQLEVRDTAIRLSNDGEIEREVDPQAMVNVLAWYFVVKRATRIKKGWHVIGLSLEQEGEFVPVYTFASPDDFENMPLSDQFAKLVKPDKKKKNDNTKSVHGMRRAGEQRRLLEAETDRGIFGAEVTLEQFIVYLKHLQAHYPDWMITDS